MRSAETWEEYGSTGRDPDLLGERGGVSQVSAGAGHRSKYGGMRGIAELHRITIHFSDIITKVGA